MADKSRLIFNKLKQSRLVALLNPSDSRECVTAYELCDQEDIILEIALRSPGAVEGIRKVTARYPDALVLAGTVMTARQARAAAEAGAAGIVSADYIPEVVDECIRRDIMCVPGGLSDVGKQLEHKARGYGVSWEELRTRYPHQWVYKLFPAFFSENNLSGISHAWKGPFPELMVFYTGGIRLENLADAAARDASGIFCASVLTRNIDRPEEMKKDLKKWKQAIKGIQDSGTPSSAKPPISFSGVRVVTMGELMLRLSPPSGERLKSTGRFTVHFGGAEANVAASLSQFGAESEFVTALPDNDVGDNALAYLRKFGISTASILRRGERLGIYYLEHGHGPRPSQVIYDRDRSSFTRLAPGDIDWDKILENTAWFHWTGITPALGDSAAGSLKEGLQTARDKGVTVSVDLNYRKKLWSEEKAKTVMRGLMPYVQILMGNEEDPQRVFGIKPENTDVEKGKISREGYRSLSERIFSEFALNKVSITLRESLSATENYWSACLYNGKEFFVSPRYHVWILDRVGSGDAFAAGLIWSLLQEKSDQEALDFGVAAAVLKHSVYGDFNPASAEEVEGLASGDTAGRVKR